MAGQGSGDGRKIARGYGCQRVADLAGTAEFGEVRGKKRVAPGTVGVGRQGHRRWGGAKGVLGPYFFVW